MLDNSYYKYKKLVLDSINNNTFSIVDNYDYQCICDVPEEYLLAKKYLKNNIVDSIDYDKYLVDCTEKKLSVHTANLPKLSTGEVLCLDYYDYAWKNNLIHGNISWTNGDIPRSKSYKDAVVQEGQILYLGESFFESCFKYTAYDVKNTFVISDIDDDGIVVLPPNCSILWCLDKQNINKLKKLIMIGSSFTPYIVYVDENQYLASVPNSSYELIDVSNIDVEFYSTSKSINITNIYADFDTAINKDYNYKFNKAYCSYTPLSRISYGNYQIHLSGIFYEFDIVLDDFDKNFNDLEISWNRDYRYKLETEVNIIIHNNIKSLKNLVILDSIEHNFSLSAYNFETICLGKRKRQSINERLSMPLFESLKDFTPGTTFYTTTYDFFSFGKNATILRDYLYCLNDIISRGYPIMYSFLDKDKKTCIKIEELYDYYTLLYTMNNYGEYIDDLAENQLEYKEEYLNRISRLYGISKSKIYGDLDYTKAKELFCGSDKLVELKSIDLENSTIYMELGAGVDLLVNMFQFVLLRMSGLCSYNIVTIEDKLKYGVKKDDYFDNLRASELLVFSDLTKNATINNGSSTNVFCAVNYRDYNSKAISYSDYKNVTYLSIYYLFGKSPKYNYIQKDNLRRRECKLIGSDIYVFVFKGESKIKLLQIAEKTAKAQKEESLQLRNLLGFVNNSKHAGLYGGKELSCINVSKVTKSNLPKNIIMDSVYYDTSYLIFTLEDINTGDVYKIENNTLRELLNRGEVYCHNINTTLLPGSLIWLMHDYDSQATASIERILEADLLFKSDEETKPPLYSLELYELGINMYGLRGYNIGEEFVLPSYIHEVCISNISHMKEKVIDTYGEDSWSDLKRLIIVNLLDKPLDVTNQILGLFKDKESIVYSEGIEFRCDENTVYKSSKPLVVNFNIKSSLIELPQNLSLNFSYERGSLDIIDTKIVVRKGSTIYKCKCATELDIADNVFIHTYAFSHSTLRQVTIHGGKIPTRAFYSSKLLTELIIDGGHVDIDITAFIDCDIFSKITCINGGSYTLIERDNPVELELISEYKHIPFYNEFFKEYDKTKELDSDFNEIVYPIKLNDDFTVTLIHQSGNESRLSLYKIYDYYKNGNLIFEFDANGQHYNFVETLKYSELKCLVFYPGVNNYLCNCKLLLIMNMHEQPTHYALEECKFVFGFQYDDWYNGNITDLPYSLLQKNCNIGFYFDTDAKRDTVGIEFSFYQNRSLYNNNDWNDFNFYYSNRRSNTKPEDINYFSNEKLDKLYFPASHSFDYNFRKQDNSLNKKDRVEFGLTYKYAKYMFAKRYRCKIANEVEIIPGIGENKLFVLNHISDTCLAAYSKYLWGNAKKLIISSPTLITNSALCVYTVYDNNTRSIFNNDIELYANADLQLVHCSVPFNKFKVKDSNIIYDCSEFNRTLSYDMICLDIWKNKKLSNIYIELDKTSTLQVKGLRVEDLESLIDISCYNFAYQLWNHNNEKLYSDKINKFLNDVNDGSIKVNKLAKVLKLPKVDIDITKSVIDYIPEYKDIINIYDKDTDDDNIVETDDSTIDLKESEEFKDTILDGVVDKKKKPTKPRISKKGKNIDYVEIDPDSSVDFLTLGIDDIDITEKEQSDVFNSLNIDYEGLKEQALKEKEVLTQMNTKKREKELNEQRLQSQNEQKELLNRVIERELLDQSINEDLVRKQLKLEKKQKREKARQLYNERMKEVSNSQKDTEIDSTLDDSKMNKQLYDIQSNNSVEEPEVRTDMIAKSSGLASDLLSALNHNKKSSLNKLIGLEFISKIIKNNVVIGYEIKNTDTGKIKRLSIETIEKLCKTGKYKLIGANYSLFLGIVIDNDLQEIYLK